MNSRNSSASTFKGTFLYMAPELFGNKPSFTQKADVWSLGVVLYEMCELKVPFESIADILSSAPEFSGFYSSELVILIKACLSKDPNKRPSVFKILEMPFISTKMKELNLIDETDKCEIDLDGEGVRTLPDGSK